MTSNAESPTLATALAYHEAWTGGDIEGAMAHVADDIVCHTPGSTITGKQAWHDYLHGFSQVMTGVSEVTALGDDSHVVLFYYPYTAVTNSAPAAERFTIRDGQITENLLVFDRLSYAPTPEQAAD